MSQSVYDMFKDKANNARADAECRTQEIWCLDARIKDIDKELSETGLKFLAAALKDEKSREEEYKRLERRIKALREERTKRLKEAGFAPDYTDVKYECEKCSDTGYIGIKMCDCLKHAIIKQSYKNSGLGKYLEKETFESFDLKLYPEGDIREDMEGILRRVKKYAQAFNPETSDSLLFVGGTGLGKTHLSSAIAIEVIDKGYSVSYESAQNIISAFEKERFTKSADSVALTQKYINCDLLIIDDLGTEIHTKSSISYFYTLLNTRLVSSKPTIISTNLTAKELTGQYEERIVSRLFGEYNVFLFKGEDIRKLKRQ